MRSLFLVLSFFVFVLSCGDKDSKSSSDDGLEDAQGVDLVDDGDGIDSSLGGDAHQVETSQEVDIFEEDTLEDSTCTNLSIPGCESGKKCVFTYSSNLCRNEEYSGTCETLPLNCDEALKATVCSCDGEEFEGPCAARRSGYLGPILNCPVVPLEESLWREGE